MSKRIFNLEACFFPGHYESGLTNCNTEYYAVQEERDYYENELGFACTEDDFEFDYKRREQDINELFIDAEFGMLSNLGMVDSMTYESMTSPKYYNFATDRLFANVKMSADWVLKMRAFIRENEEWLRNRIREDWSSRDGFWSFTDNDLDDWYNHLFKEFDEKYISIMLSYMLYRDNVNVREDLVYGVMEEIYDGEYCHLNEDAQKRFDDWQAVQEANKYQLEIPFGEEA